MYDVNQSGRTYTRGKALSEDFRQAVCDDLIKNGAPQGVPHFKGLHGLASKTGSKFGLHRTTVVSYWTSLCADGNLHPKKPGPQNRTKKLSDEHIAYIEYLLNDQPSLTAGDITDKLKRYSNFPDGLHRRTVARAIRSQLTPGEFTRKRLSNVHQQRFSEANMQYSQAYIDELFARNPHRIKFFDESGFKMPDSCNPKYGYAPKGVRCCEVSRYHQTPNVTLNLLISTSGIEYANTVDGASAGIDFLNFFQETSQNTHDNGEPILQAGDTIVVDNCPTHHGNAARALRQWLAQQGIDIIYMPVYSPDFNPVEFCFNKIKKMVQKPYFREIFKENIAFGIYEALKEITPGDCKGFYRHVGYLNL